MIAFMYIDSDGPGAVLAFDEVELPLDFGSVEAKLRNSMASTDTEPIKVGHYDYVIDMGLAHDRIGDKPLRFGSLAQAFAYEGFENYLASYED